MTKLLSASWALERNWGGGSGNQVQSLTWPLVMALPGKCVFKGKCELNCQIFVLNENDSLTSKSPCLACGHLAAFHEQNTESAGRFAASSSTDTQTLANDCRSGKPSSTFGRVKTFEAWKETKSSSAFRKTKSAKLKPVEEEVTINIGIMQFDRKSMALKPKWGKRLPLKTKRNASYKDILENGLAKWKVFNKTMIEENENYMLLYDDGSKAIFLPGQGKQFVILSRYKEELGRGYRRIVLFLCKEDDFEYNYSCHVLGEDPQLQSIGEELEEEGSALKGKKVQDEEDVSGDELSHHGAQHESLKKKTNVIDDKEYGSDELTEVLNVSSNMNCPGPGSSATSSGITFSGSVPEEFLWGDFDEIDENELVRAAIARSLENQSNSTEDIELQQLIEAFQKETSHHCETCSIVVLRKKLLKTCMRAVQERSFEFTKMPCIVFTGEDSVDLGGPRREFFRLLMQAVCKEFGVFEGNPNLVFSHDHSVIATETSCIT